MSSVEIFTGIRPTGSLTIANYLAALRPMIELQQSGARPLIFVADLHALTTHSPAEARASSRSVIIDSLALGLDPEGADMYLQSDIRGEILELTAFLMRHVSLAELMRMPTLKDKLKGETSVESANAFLASYPVLMAADILIHRAKKIPVGEDQVAHIEMTKKLARRFNNEFGEVFPMPEALSLGKPLRIMGLKGSGKMGKSHPEEAIFLNDPPKKISKRIKSAMTAFEGEMNPVLQSHIALVKEVAQDNEVNKRVDEIIEAHLNGEAVMGKFKVLFSEVVLDFVEKYQNRRAEIESNPRRIDQILKTGKEVALASANATMEAVRSAMRF